MGNKEQIEFRLQYNGVLYVKSPIFVVKSKLYYVGPPKVIKYVRSSKTRIFFAIIPKSDRKTSLSGDNLNAYFFPKERFLYWRE